MSKSNDRLALESWDKNSSVRSKPNNYGLQHFCTATEKSRDWYPRAMLPFLERPWFENMPDGTLQKLLARHLIYFLDYTTRLEHLMVNRSLEVVIYDALKVPVSDFLKTAALQIYTDEGYHALFSRQLSNALADEYQIVRPDILPYRIRALYDFLDTFPIQDRDLIYFSIGFVSETIIAKEISRVTSEDLAAPAYALLTDHLRDEAIHALYFADVFKAIWINCSTLQRNIMIGALPAILKIFCSSDTPWLTSALTESEVPTLEIELITSRLNDANTLTQRVAAVGGMTFSVLRNVGVFENEQYVDSFKSEGLPYA